MYKYRITEYESGEFLPEVQEIKDEGTIDWLPLWSVYNEICYDYGNPERFPDLKTALNFVKMADEKFKKEQRRKTIVRTHEVNLDAP